MNPIGVNTWVWVSPATDAAITELAPRAKAMGFALLELGVEQPGDWDPARVAEILAAHDLGASVCAAMGPGRDLTDPTTDRLHPGLHPLLYRRGRDPGLHRGGRPHLHPGRQDLADGRGGTAGNPRPAGGGAAPAGRRRGGAWRAPRDRAAESLRDQLPQHRRADDGGRRSRRLPRPSGCCWTPST